MRLFKLLTLGGMVISASSLLEAAPVCVKPVQFFVKGGISTNNNKIHAIPNAEKLLRAVNSINLISANAQDKDNKPVTVSLTSNNGVDYALTLPDEIIGSMIKDKELTTPAPDPNAKALPTAYLHAIKATAANTDKYKPLTTDITIAPTAPATILVHTNKPNDQENEKVKVSAKLDPTVSQPTYEKGILTIPINSKVTAQTITGDMPSNIDETAEDYFIWDGDKNATEAMKAKDIFATVVNDNNELKITMDPTLQFKLPARLFSVPAYNDVPKNYSAGKWGADGIVEGGIQFNAPHGGSFSISFGGLFPFSKELTLKPGEDPDTDGKTDVDDFVNGTIKAKSSFTMALTAAVDITDNFSLGLEGRYTMAKYASSIAFKQSPAFGKVSKDYKLNTYSVGPKVMFNFTKNIGLELGVNFVSGGKLKASNSNKKNDSKTSSNNDAFFSLVKKPSVGFNASFVVKF